MRLAEFDNVGKWNSSDGRRRISFAIGGGAAGSRLVAAIDFHFVPAGTKSLVCMQNRHLPNN
jgi:hypothetical protein